MQLIRQAEAVFIRDLDGRSEIDPIHATFKANGLLDQYSDEEKIARYEKDAVRALLRRMSIILETDGERLRVRAVHNLEKWQDETKKHEYVYLTKMTIEEVSAVALRYHSIGKVYIAIGDALMDVATGQMLLFKR